MGQKKAYMNKELFVKAIEAIREQSDYDISVSENLGRAFPDSDRCSLMPQNHWLRNALLRVLQAAMNDAVNGESWIEYYCFKLRFGKESNRLKSYDNGREIPLSNAWELWDYLNSRSEDSN